MKYLIEHRGEVLLGKAHDLPKNKLRRGERLCLFLIAEVGCKNDFYNFLIKYYNLVLI